MSLTESRDSVKHWEHYADGKKGVCIVFSRERLKESLKCGLYGQRTAIILEPMVYAKDTMQIQIERWVTEAISIPFYFNCCVYKLYDQLNRQIKDSDYDWANEYRIYTSPEQIQSL